MDKQSVEALDELLTEADDQEQTLLIQFFDDEVYELTSFCVCQDDDEDYPHCCPFVVRVIKASKDRFETFSSKVAMLFYLNDVKEVRDPISGEVSFRNEK